MYEDDTSMGEIGGLLADIREMFPVPERGSELEVALAGAMALPQCVPAYVQMWLNKQQEERKQVYSTLLDVALYLTDDLGKQIDAMGENSKSITSNVSIAKQPTPNDKWCIGCNPDNCSGCGV